MKQPKLNQLKLDSNGTKIIRALSKTKKTIKITINIDAEILFKIRKESEKTGVPYQRLLNQLLKSALKEDDRSSERLNKIEKDLETLKKKFSA